MDLALAAGPEVPHVGCQGTEKGRDAALTLGRSGLKDATVHARGGDEYDIISLYKQKDKIIKKRQENLVSERPGKRYRTTRYNASAAAPGLPPFAATWAREFQPINNSTAPEDRDRYDNSIVKYFTQYRRGGLVHDISHDVVYASLELHFQR